MKILIGLIILLLSGFTGCGVTVTNTQVDDVKPLEDSELKKEENADVSKEFNNQDYSKYYSAIKENDDFKKRFGDSRSPVKFYLAYINDDDIPEMIMANENIHTSQVTIYSYNEDKGEIYYLGSIGTTATIYYYPKENYITCSYGNNGFFVSVSYSIIDGKLNANNTYASNGNNGKYYGGIKTSENLENESLDYYIDLALDDAYEITEEECENDSSHNIEIQSVSYDEMFDLD